VPLWAWLIGGGALTLLLLTIVGAVLWYVWPLWGNSAFTLKVLKAPAGSKVFVDDIDRSGVPQADGTIIIQGLKAGEPREVRVAHEDYEDYDTTVTGESGQISEITYKSPLKETKKPPLLEIDYVGKMMLVSAGPFTMGDDKHLPDEKPAHQVTLPAYYIDKYEVTNEQYKKFCEETNHATPANPFWDTQYFESNPQMPVVGVSFADATAYAVWAGKRLPSEDVAEASRANINSQHPTPVGQYPNGASAYGVHDMAGNVQEWVDGFYQAYQGNTARDPKFGNTLRVARGGSFPGKIEDVRTTRRLPIDPSFKTNPEDAQLKKSSVVGFRCAVSANDPKLATHLQQAKK
jgi:iron(II)-dependent oxidoreductase